MVLLRLRVVVFPREQLSSSRRMFSFLPNHDEPNASLSGSAKPASFLLVVPSPEDVSLAGLSGLIQDKWKKLYPDLGRLVIKKLLDSENPDDDLDPDMTVADVFVDSGKARREGLDQRGTLHVIQKPAQSPPVRFPSVDIDWDSAASRYELQRKTQQENLPSICEDEGKTEASGSPRRASSASMLSSQFSHTHDQPDEAEEPSLPATQRHRGLSLSVETNKNDPSVDYHDSPPVEIHEDIDMPPPQNVRETRSRKRKQSLEQAEPRKEPKLQTSNSPTSTPPQRRQRVPSFSGPSRIPADQLSASQRRLGVGIMTSPPGRKPVQRHVGKPISEPNLAPAHQPILDSAKKLYSILRKESPADGSQTRGSVSFTDDSEPSSSFPAPTPTPREPAGHQSSQKTDLSADSTKATQVRASFLPPGVSPEMAQKCMDDIEQERREREDLSRMAEDPNTDPKALKIIKRLLSEWAKLIRQESGPHRRHDRIANRRKEMSKLRKDLQAFTVDRETEAALPSSSSKTSQAIPPTSPSPVAPAEAALPSSSKEASRAIPTPSPPPAAPAEAALPPSSKEARRAIPTPSPPPAAPPVSSPALPSSSKKTSRAMPPTSPSPVAPVEVVLPSSSKKASRIIPPTSPAVAPPVSSPAPPSASRKATPTNRPTLKGLLEEQRKEMAARAATQQKPTAAAPPPRRNIYEESSDEDSDGNSASDSELGDIMPDGRLMTLRRPYLKQ